MREPVYGPASVVSSVEADLFWQFSLALYARAGVKAACLALQNRHGVDVNILFFCIWWPCSGMSRLDRQDFEDVLAEAYAWHRQVVLGLRATRRMLSAGGIGPAWLDNTALRKQVLAVELEAEHTEQTILARTATKRLSAYPTGQARQPAQIAEEIANYFAWAGIRDDADDAPHLETIVRQAIETPSSRA